MDDLIVGAYGADSQKGKSYVVFGKTDTQSINLGALGDDSKYGIDLLGDENVNKNDTLTGTTADEIFVAGVGSDILTGNGGMDVFNAGMGDDTIIINASNITALEETGDGNRARVDGGGNTSTGVDTLKLDGSGLVLDLTKISNNRIQDIEKIDITGSGNNTLKLDLNDLLDASSSTNILKVVGDAGDSVIAAGFTKTGTNGSYDVYTHSDANTDAGAALWLDGAVLV
ncbi:calcium binding hemolysin protein, putative [hydrothermal vent metagenome]|uniref:Calcium binding hemolysin protein, putative n=1 Tax=hydrothermal vent metagenome TaxID=652676 RepID=A0A1W1E5W6_9ZZZZ